MPSPSTAALTLLMTTALLLKSAVADDSTVSPAQLRDTRDPSQDTDDMLQRYVDEFVHVTPGSGLFPEVLRADERLLVPPAPFRIARYETTQELYRAVTGTNPSRWPGPRNSVDSVSRQDAEVFCTRITEFLRRRGSIGPKETVRLPTQTEWEYSCRGGSAESYCFGNIRDDADLQTLGEYAWHTGNAAGNDPAVGVLRPNQFGLCDMHGYLWEHVAADPGAATNSNASSVQLPVEFAMGGSWRDHHKLLASDCRIPVPVYAVSDAIGFRCVLASDEGDRKNSDKQ